MKGAKTILAAVAACGLLAAMHTQAQTPVVAPQIEPTYERSDSVSAAFATILADAFDNALKQQFPDSPESQQLFLDGFEKSFSLNEQEYIYYRAMAEGLNLLNNLDAMRYQGYPVDNDKFLMFLKASLAGQPTGFTITEADDYLSGIVPTPEPVEIEEVVVEE